VCLAIWIELSFQAGENRISQHFVMTHTAHVSLFSGSKYTLYFDIMESGSKASFNSLFAVGTRLQWPHAEHLLLGV